MPLPAEFMSHDDIKAEQLEWMKNNKGKKKEEPKNEEK
jgi:hypothetical protein